MFEKSPYLLSALAKSLHCLVAFVSILEMAMMYPTDPATTTTATISTAAALPFSVYGPHLDNETNLSGVEKANIILDRVQHAERHRPFWLADRDPHFKRPSMAEKTDDKSHHHPTYFCLTYVDAYPQKVKYLPCSSSYKTEQQWIYTLDGQVRSMYEQYACLGWKLYVGQRHYTNEKLLQTPKGLFQIYSSQGACSKKEFRMEFTYIADDDENEDIGNSTSHEQNGSPNHHQGHSPSFKSKSLFLKPCLAAEQFIVQDEAHFPVLSLSKRNAARMVFGLNHALQ